MSKIVSRIYTAYRNQIYSTFEVGDQALLELLFPTLNEIGGCLSSEILRYPFLRLMNNGKAILADDLLPSKATGSVFYLNKDLFQSQWQKGTSLILHHLESYLKKIRKIREELIILCDSEVQANAYITPPKSYALPMHSDSHDVCIIQISGRKNWVIDSNNITHHLELKRGDCIFIPKGVRHKAASDDSASYHITIGFINKRINSNKINQPIINSSKHSFLSYLYTINCLSPRDISIYTNSGNPVTVDPSLFISDQKSSFCRWVVDWEKVQLFLKAGCIIKLFEPLRFFKIEHPHKYNMASDDYNFCDNLLFDCDGFLNYQVGDEVFQLQSHQIIEKEIHLEGNWLAKTFTQP